MDLGLGGKVAIVTGGSRGLGKAVARTLAEEGANVILAARDPDVLGAAAREIEAAHGRAVRAVPTDVTRQDQVEKLAEVARSEFGRVDVLVANAGGPPASRFDSTELSQWRDAIELNLFSTIQLCRAVVPSMRENRSGRVVAITSISVKQPVDGLILSNTARAGVAGLMKTLATELAPEGVGVNVVCPGYTRTDRLVELARRMATQQGVSEEEIHRRWTAQIPMGRLGEAEEFAAVVAFLCSEKASYVTGTCLQVDGGVVRSLV